MPTSFAQIRSALQAPVFGVVLALTACASLPPPTAELATAQQAVTRADDADANQYAPDVFAQARTTLGQAQAAMANGRETDARALALQAAASADLARARSVEVAANAELAQRRSEITELKKRLGVEDGQ